MFNKRSCNRGVVAHAPANAAASTAGPYVVRTYTVACCAFVISTGDCSDPTGMHAGNVDSSGNSSSIKATARQGSKKQQEAATAAPTSSTENVWIRLDVPAFWRLWQQRQPLVAETAVVAERRPSWQPLQLQPILSAGAATTIVTTAIKAQWLPQSGGTHAQSRACIVILCTEQWHGSSPPTQRCHRVLQLFLLTPHQRLDCD